MFSFGLVKPVRFSVNSVCYPLVWWNQLYIFLFRCNSLLWLDCRNRGESSWWLHFEYYNVWNNVFLNKIQHIHVCACILRCGAARLRVLSQSAMHSISEFIWRRLVWGPAHVPPLPLWDRNGWIHLYILMCLFSDVNNAYEMVLFVEGNIIAVTTLTKCMWH